VAKHIDCAEGHPSIRIGGKDDNELVANAQAHVKAVHPQMPVGTREQFLKVAKEG
jgi:uncharacterized short protein YbdD (DUF466 family)